MEFVFYSKCMLMLEQVFWSSWLIISCERQTANQMYPVFPTLLYGWLLVTRGCLEGFPVFNLQLVLASRSIISKRWKLPLLQAAFEWQISFIEQLLLSCFIYQTLHILAFSSHLNPPDMGTAPIVLVPCLFHHSYWSTEFFSVHFPFAFSDLWLKSWKKFTFVKLLIHPLTRL